MTSVRERRKQDTRREILEAAVEVMAERGVAALSLSEVARRVGMRQPSLYKHFASLNDVYDALFHEGSCAARDAVREAVEGASAGLAALRAAVEAMGRLGMANPVVGQLLFWRPVPGFEPSAEAFAPNVEMVAVVRGVLRDAVDRCQLHPKAATDEGVALLSSIIAGVMTQQFANEPGATYESGRFTSLMPQAIKMFVQHHAPKRRSR